MKWCYDKMNNKKSVSVFAFFALILVGIAQLAIPATNVIASSRQDVPLTAIAVGTAPISGTFLMNDFTITSNAQADALMKEMSDTGINKVIFLSSGNLTYKDGKKGTGYTELFQFASGSTYRILLRSAMHYHMTIYFGLAAPGSTNLLWYDGSLTNKNTNTGRMVDYSVQLVDQIKQVVQAEGWSWDDPAFAGFYINPDNDLYNFMNPQSKDIQYLAQISKRVHEMAPGKKVLFSPYVWEKMTYTEVKQATTNIFSHTNIDIIALQDSMGTQKTSSIARNTDHFRALADAVKAFPHKQVWDNVESFTDVQEVTDNNPPYKPTSIDTLQNQIASGQPYVNKMITWIYQHTMLSDQQFNNLSSWDNEFTPELAAQRVLLRNAYMKTYIYPDEKNQANSSTSTTNFMQWLFTTILKLPL